MSLSTAETSVPTEPPGWSETSQALPAAPTGTAGSPRAGLSGQVRGSEHPQHTGCFPSTRDAEEAGLRLPQVHVCPHNTYVHVHVCTRVYTCAGTHSHIFTRTHTTHEHTCVSTASLLIPLLSSPPPGASWRSGQDQGTLNWPVTRSWGRGLFLPLCPSLVTCSRSPSSNKCPSDPQTRPAWLRVQD